MGAFAKFVGLLASGFVTVLGRFMAFKLALKYSAYATWLVVFGIFLGTVFVCISALAATVTALLGLAGGINGGFLAALAMGLGMFIPANAGSVLACLASVWIATNIYKVQKAGLQYFGS
jgi:hypothetical protein